MLSQWPEELKSKYYKREPFTQNIILREQRALKYTKTWKHDGIQSAPYCIQGQDLEEFSSVHLSSLAVPVNKQILSWYDYHVTTRNPPWAISEHYIFCDELVVTLL